MSDTNGSLPDPQQAIEAMSLNPEMLISKGPLSIFVSRVHLTTDQGTVTVVKMNVIHATGMNVFLMMPDFAKSVANDLTQAATGLVIAGSDDVP